MRAVKRERSKFKEEASLFQFDLIFFFIPRWWSVKEETSDQITFYRQDTHYDWFAQFKKTPSSLSFKEFVEDYFTRRKIILDDRVDTTENPKHLFKNSEMHTFFHQGVRFEGTGTENQVDRIYLDVYFLQRGNFYFVFESKSSVLNGGIEGPYFEEAIYLAKVKNDD